MQDAVNLTSYRNGTIRNTAGKLVAIYDESSQELIIDGFVQTFRAVDISHAMDIINEQTR